MYEFVEGELVSKSPTSVVINVSGVGYQLRVPLSTSKGLPEAGPVRLLVHFYVREDSQRLYGFATAEERRVFLKLMAVPKVGPSLALAVLSGLSLGELREAIIHQRAEILKRVKGIGAATAERIVRELQRDPPVLPGGASTRGPAPADKEQDVVAALLTLGYQRSSAENVSRRAMSDLGPDATLEDLVTEALRII